jgi:hypothetical protein
VTVDRVSKARDYAGAMLYYILVPVAALPLRRGLERYHRRLAPRLAGERRVLSAALFALPYALAPFLFLTTRKELWGILFPLAVCSFGPLALHAHAGRRAARDLFGRESLPVHALLLTEGASWVLFRYLATGARIGHIPTLFLEVPFAIFFTLLFWAAAILVARTWALSSFGSTIGNAAKVGIAATPLLFLPLATLGRLDPRPTATIAWGGIAAGAVALLLWRRSIAVRIRPALAWIVIPALLFVVGWASVAGTLRWIDLFHRGESLGPAAEYLAGEVPYRDVFVLHGLLEDGLLDAWLMRGLGADVAVSNGRIVILSALALVALWMLALLLFDSIPLALTVILLGAMMFVENPRSFFELAVLALLFAGLWSGRRVPTVAAGAFSALAVFYSIDVGLYSVFGSVTGIAGWGVWLARQRAAGTQRSRAPILWYLGGLAAGAAPFLAWLGIRGAVGDFVRVSFVEVPRYIDPVWSLPFPDLASFFRSGLEIRAIAEFLLGERSRFLLNPLVIGIALVALLARFLKRSSPEKVDLALLLLCAFGVVTQRSALGRADFPHQHFSAFLLAPTVVTLLVLLGRATAPHWREARPAAPLVLALLALAAIPLAGGLLWAPDLMAARLDSIVGYRAQRDAPVEDAATAEVSDRIEAVSREIRRLAAPGESIFDFSNQPAFYFFSARRNPTRFFQIPIASPPRFQLEILRDLERARPRLVLRDSPQDFDRFDGISNDLRAQAVAGYIDALYEHERTVRGVEIWVRRPGARAGDLTRFARLVTIPPAAVPLAPVSVVVPAVASTRGAAGSEWTSDLVAQNSSHRPLDLRMRYASNRGTRDVKVTLAPSQLMTWEDFPRSLFGTGESAGVLWVEYPPDQRPILFAQTRDRARGGPPARSTPLGQGDAADARSGLDALRIAGVRTGATTRVNVVVINMGAIPARFRIQARGANGAGIGAPVEWEVAEGDSALIGDVSTRLGVTLDGTVVIEIAMQSGRAAAYATVIDGVAGIHELIPALPTSI